MMLEESHQSWVKEDVSLHEAWCSGACKVSSLVISHSRHISWSSGSYIVIIEVKFIENLGDILRIVIESDVMWGVCWLWGHVVGHRHHHCRKCGTESFLL
jgi:hypothetical protein